MVFQIPQLIDVISLCWVIFISYWIVSAFFVKKTVERQGFFWRGIFIVILILFFLIIRLMPSNYLKLLLITIVPNTVISLIIGSIITVFGLCITIWARATLGSNWSGAVTFKKNHELITRGPYKFVRHPIYTGLMTMLIGTFIVYGFAYVLLAIIIFFLGLIGKLMQEEKLMIKHFGKKYIDYKNKTKALIPFIL